MIKLIPGLHSWTKEPKPNPRNQSSSRCVGKASVLKTFFNTWGSSCSCELLWAPHSTKRIKQGQSSMTQNLGPSSPTHFDGSWYFLAFALSAATPTMMAPRSSVQPYWPNNRHHLAIGLDLELCGRCFENWIDTNGPKDSHWTIGSNGCQKYCQQIHHQQH